MNRTEKAAAELLQQMLSDEAELEGFDEPLDMAQVREDIAQWRERFPHCVSVVTFFEDASARGWNDTWHAPGHAANCPECGSGVLVALRNRAPGLWVARPVERDTAARPLWWTQAVEAYLAEAPRSIQWLAAAEGLADRIAQELRATAELVKEAKLKEVQAAASPARRKEGKKELFSTHDYHPEDQKMRVDFREVEGGAAGAEFVLAVRDSNLRAKREGMLVQTGLITESGRLDRTLRLKKDKLGLSAEVVISAAELEEIDAEARTRGEPIVAILPPRILEAEQAAGVVGDNESSE
jgi:hypothetical protein